MLAALESPGASLLHVRILPQRLPVSKLFASTFSTLLPLLPHEMIIGATRELCDVRDVVVNAPEPLTMERFS